MTSDEPPARPNCSRKRRRVTTARWRITFLTFNAETAKTAEKVLCALSDLCARSSYFPLFQTERPANSARDVRPEHVIVRPDVGAVTHRCIEDPALAERSFPRLRIVAAFHHLRQVPQVAAFGVDAQKDMHAVTREAHWNPEIARAADVFGRTARVPRFLGEVVELVNHWPRHTAKHSGGGMVRILNLQDDDRALPDGSPIVRAEHFAERWIVIKGHCGAVCANECLAVAHEVNQRTLLSFGEWRIAVGHHHHA